MNLDVGLDLMWAVVDEKTKKEGKRKTIHLLNWKLETSLTCIRYGLP